jgi:hypothetical protein
MVSYFGTTSKHAETLKQVRHLNGGLAWRRVQALLKNLGAEIYEGSGSTVAFVLKGRKLVVDKPHPRKECGRGLVRRVRSFLDELGYLGEFEEKEQKT